MRDAAISWNVELKSCYSNKSLSKAVFTQCIHNKFIQPDHPPIPSRILWSFQYCCPRSIGIVSPKYIQCCSAAVVWWTWLFVHAMSRSGYCWGGKRDSSSVIVKVSLIPMSFISWVKVEGGVGGSIGWLTTVGSLEAERLLCHRRNSCAMASWKICLVKSSIWSCCWMFQECMFALAIPVTISCPSCEQKSRKARSSTDSVVSMTSKCQ